MNTAKQGNRKRMRFFIQRIVCHALLRPLRFPGFFVRFVIAEDGTNQQRIPVIQVWLDPDYPGAIDDPELRAYIMRRGAEDCATLVRLDARRAVTVLPPTLCTDGQWHIIGGESAGPQWSTWPEQVRKELQHEP